jgi:hypothetical protein
MLLAGTVTFGALGLYERQYRPKIERGRYLLTDYVNLQTQEIVTSIKLPMEPSSLQLKLNQLVSMNGLVRRPESLLAWRRYQIGMFVLLGLLALLGPEAQPGRADTSI